MSKIDTRNSRKDDNLSFVIDADWDVENYTKESSSNLFETSIYELLRIYSIFLYYLFIFPYKVVEVGANNIEFVTSRIRQVFCLTCHLFCHIILILNLQSSMSGKSIQEDPTKLFRIATAITYVATSIQFTIMCLRNNNGLRSLLTITHSVYGNKSRESKTIKSTILAVVVYIGVIFVTIRYAIGKFDPRDTISSPMDLINSIYKDRYNFLSWEQVDRPLENEDVTMLNVVWKISVAIVCIFCPICIALISYNCDAFVHFLGILFYIASKDFWKIVEQKGKNSNDPEELLLLYRELKSLTEDINKVTGMQVLIFLTAGVPYYASNFAIMFDTPDWGVRLAISYYLIAYIGSMSFAAEAYRTIQGFPDYIYRNFSTKFKGQQKQDQYNYALWMTEISTTQVGLKGHGFFTISYSFLGNMVGLMVTYIIILLQFQSSPHHE